MPIQLTSSAFSDGTSIPDTYTCDAEGISPPLAIAGVPDEAKSLALTVDDPDAPNGLFVHWLVWNIDPKTERIGEGSVPDGSVQGESSSGVMEWVPPCPPSGTHRYVFTIYALDRMLDLKAGATRDELIEAMEGRVLASAELTGSYGR